jgi:hypothetical protein
LGGALGGDAAAVAAGANETTCAVLRPHRRCRNPAVPKSVPYPSTLDDVQWIDKVKRPALAGLLREPSSGLEDPLSMKLREYL